MRTLGFRLALGVFAAVLVAGVAAPGWSIAADARAAQLAERRQLTGEQILERIVGRMLHWQRPRQKGSHNEVWLVIRPDGSMLSKCEKYNGRSSDWHLCTGRAIGASYEGWSNGVWAIEGDLFCNQTGVATMTGRNCYRLHDDGGGGLFAEIASGDRPSSMPGAIDVRSAENIRCIGNIRESGC